MARKTKKEIEANLKDDLVKSFKDYISKNGKQITKKFIYWDTYPVCVKDVCVTTVAVVDNYLVFGDYTEGEKEFKKIFHTDNDLDYSYLYDAFEDVKKIDTNKKKIAKNNTN